jgi:predicted deacylase
MLTEAQPILYSDFRVADFAEGTKSRLHLILNTLPSGEPLYCPVLLARGNNPGPVCMVTGLVHGDEYEGPVAIQDVFAELDTADMRGTFFGIPMVNGPAFTAGTREGGLDHLNLARIFPGAAQGSPTERIAHIFQENLVVQADFLLEMHAGGNLYACKELAGYQVQSGPAGERLHAAAIAFGFDLVWGTEALPGRTLSAARIKEVPAIYVENRGEGRLRSAQRTYAVQGIRNILAFLGIVEGDYPTAEPEFSLQTLGEEAGHLQVNYPSPYSGLFVPAVELWDVVSEGNILGEVRHPDGTVLAEIPAVESGRVMFLRTIPKVLMGECLIYVLKMET